MPSTFNPRKILLFIGDILLLYLSLILTLIIRSFENFDWAILAHHLLPFTILYFLWLMVFYIFGFYDLSLFKSPFLFYARITAGLGLALTIGITFFYLFPFFGITPKTNLALDILVFGILSLSWRKLFYSLFSSHFQSIVAIIGENPQSEELAKIIQKNPYLGYKLIGFFDPEKDILKQILANKINTLILAENLESNTPLVKKLYQCLPSKIGFMDMSKAYEIISEKVPISFITQTWFLENLKEKQKELTDKLKRLVDVALSLAILICSFPLWPLIMMAIKLNDKGPVFYSQRRIGKGGVPFLLIKFRSMRKNAEKETGAVWAEKKDPRITRVGKFLRQTHLDEIPQMINILKGDISLVGPRPERPEFVTQLEKEIPYYRLRHLIKPGFTGWAQVKFPYARSVEDSFEKFQYDLYYIKNRNLFLDLRILLKTFNLLFKRE